jgi:hypothetical protein
MKCLVVAFLMTVISFACCAQDSVEYRACSDKANTQSEMTACASEEAARVDAKLKTHIARYWQESRANPKPSQKLKPPKEPGSPTAMPISRPPTRQKTKPPNSAPSILSKSLCFKPSSRGAKSAPLKTCCSTTRPSKMSERRAGEFELLEIPQREENCWKRISVRVAV